MAGRPKIAEPTLLYSVAQQFYWDFRRLAEGDSRRRCDEKEYQDLIRGLDVRSFLSEDDKQRLRQIVDEEIKEGGLEATKKDEESETFARREQYRIAAARQATKQKHIPGEPDVLNALLQVKSADSVREICKDAFVLREFEVQPGVFKEAEVRNWPVAFGSTLPRYLSQYGEAFVEALNDKRFPRCDLSLRPTNRLKQLWFLSRSLAGAVLGVKPRTAVNLVGSTRPEQVFADSRAAKPARNRKAARKKS